MPLNYIIEDCVCPTPSPSPTCSPCADNPSEDCTAYNPSVDKVRMFFGEYRTTNKVDIYFTYNHIDGSRPIYHEDFLIPNYPAQYLIDAGILPSTGEGSFSTFTLSERELLSTATFEGWLFYIIDYAEGCESEFDEPFGIKCARALGLDVNKMIERAGRIFDNTRRFFDNAGMGMLTNDLINPISIEDETDRNNLLQKFKACYDWLVEIYNTYYGKQFLVRIGEKLPVGTHVPFKGVCVKDNEGNYPDSSLSGNCPIIVEGDGSGQGLHLSDMVSREGGFPKRPYDQILLTPDLLGLPLSKNDIEWITTEDGRIQSFVKFGKISDISENPIKFYKFGSEFIVDLENMNSENFYIYYQQNDDSNDGQYLYIKAEVHDKIYLMDDQNLGEDGIIPGGQWVVVELKEMVPLKLIDDELAIIKGAMYHLLLSDLRQQIIKDYLRPDPSNSEIGNGTIPNQTQLNVLQMQRISVFPEGFVVPMKSNIFNYGPYYYSANNNDAGGTSIVSEDSLCPWNFLKIKADGGLNLNNAYTNMDCVGKALAKDSTSPLQQLETGKITVASLPSYGLGYAINNGPTLLTDISVDYGSNGVLTTYNFETYTPRFGRPGQYIIDAWADNIRKIQHTNKYLKEERLRALRQSNQIYQKKLTIPKQAVDDKSSASVDTYTKSASPNRLLISGFYFENELNLTENNQLSGSIPSCECTGSEPLDSGCPGASSDCGPMTSNCCECECSASPSSSPNASESPSPNPSSDGNKFRLYAFAETDKGYQANHVQKDTYKYLSVMSLDGLFLPVSLAANDDYTNVTPNPSATPGRISRFATHQGLQYSKSLDTIPPFLYKNVVQYQLAIFQEYLNPMISVEILKAWDGRKNGTNRGFTISTIAYGTEFDKFTPLHDYTEEMVRQKSTDFRFNALRGPLVIQGWGYDLTGKPIPNAADDPRETEKGNFVNCHLTDKFMKNWIDNPKTWPVGPVDLRFDRKRGVWTCPTPNKILVAKLKSDLPSFGSATARLVNPNSSGSKFYDDHDYIDGVDGENIKCDLVNTEITVYDYLGINLPSCSLVYIYYLGYNKYIVLEGRRVKTDSGCEDCWLGFEELKNAANYKANTKQALIHTPSSGNCDGGGNNGVCLSWEDIIECSPSPSPSGCTCDNLYMNNFNPSGSGKINIIFPYDIKEAAVSTDNGTVSITNNPDCNTLLELEITGGLATCVGDDEYELGFNVTYKKCCDNDQFILCSDRLTLTFNVNNFPTCECETGNYCNWTYISIGTSNCNSETLSAYPGF